MDKFLHIVRKGQEIRTVLRFVAIILVKGDIVYIIVVTIQRGCLPLRKCRHPHKGAAAGYQFDGGIHQLHSFGRFLRDSSVFLHIFMP